MYTNLKTLKMESPSKNTATPAVDNTAQVSNAQKMFFKTLFANLNGDALKHLQKMMADGASRKAKQSDIVSFYSTGLFTKEEFVSAMANIPGTEKEGKLLFLNAWLNSDNKPSKEECISLMSSFSASGDAGDMVAETMLARPDLTMKFISDNIFEGKISVSTSFYLAIYPKIEQFKQRDVK